MNTTGSAQSQAAENAATEYVDAVVADMENEVYFAAACGHKHSTAQDAASCSGRGGWCWATLGPWPVVRVTLTPGRITRTEVVPDGT